MADVLFMQIESFTSAKDWALLLLLSLVLSLIGTAWADLRGKARTLEGKLETKISQDSEGYQRLARCEERISLLFRLVGRRGPEGSNAGEDDGT